MSERIYTFPRYELAATVLGLQDKHLKLLAAELPCHVVSRGDTLHVTGDEATVDALVRVVEELVFLAQAGGVINEQQVNLAISMVKSGKADQLHALFADTLNITVKGRTITPKTEGQKVYVDAIRRNTITFGIGPAGTGKTYLAVAAAVDALERQEIRRILLTRPAVEAGEKLGFLPGDLSQKVDPYLRPLYDALFEMLGFERVEKLIERNVIEIAPLAYMRGRTLNDAFIILDEGQNTTVEQMKMFLTRIGFNSKAVITGDITQIDLPRNVKSGLRHSIEVLNGVDGLSFNFFQATDVVRHPVVARIVQAYEKFEQQKAAAESKIAGREESSS